MREIIKFMKNEKYKIDLFFSLNFLIFINNKRKNLRTVCFLFFKTILENRFLKHREHYFCVF